MKLSMDAKNKLFKRFKAGDGASLLDLLEGEREGLYDYLLRMTGQVSRSSDTVDEVYQSLTETDETLNAIESCVDLRICLYKTARKFNADIWNADTAKLVNSLLEGPVATESSLLGGGERQTLAALDRKVRCLAGRERDVVLLTGVAAFGPAEASEILATDEGDVRLLLRVVTAKLGGEGAIKALAQLPLHELPPKSSQATVNLSMVMQGIKTKPVGLWSPTWIVLLALALAAAALWFWQPDRVGEWVDALLGHARP